MKHTHAVTIPERREEKVSHVTCDICKRSDDTNVNHITNSGHCDFDNVEIEFNDIEMNYPECANGTIYSYDICQECFVNKVMPALLGMGAKPTVKEWDR